MRLAFIAPLLALAIALTGCGAPATSADATSISATPAAEAATVPPTAEPTARPAPSAAPTDAPTNTPAPTIAPAATATPGPTAAPQPSTAPTAEYPHGLEPYTGGSIIYLDADGATIKRAYLDGSPTEVVYTIERPADATVVDVRANQIGSALVYGLRSETDGTTSYALLHEGQVIELGLLASAPRWSPDGTRLLLETLPENQGFTQIELYRLVNGLREPLGIAGTPDWYPDAQAIVYVAPADPASSSPSRDVFRYELASGSSTRLTNLPTGDGGPWLIQEAHVLPAGQIIFYGNQESELGVGYNGMRWWWVPAKGSGAEPFSKPNGSGIISYDTAWEAGVIAFAERVTSGDCSGEDTLVFNFGDVHGGIEAAPPLPELYERPDGLVLNFNGVSWAPDGETLAFGFQTVACGSPGETALPERQAIYAWDTRIGNGEFDLSISLREVAQGTFPSWVR